MTEGVLENIKRLIALYEREKVRGDEALGELRKERSRNEELEKEVGELKAQNDNLKLQISFGANVDKAAAVARIDRMIKDIDRCLALLSRPE